MTLRLNGSTSGYVEIDAPAVAGNNTLVLPSSGDLAVTTQLGTRNQLINGDFRIWQRGTNFSFTAAPQFTADHWRTYGTGTSVAIRSQDVPENEGFTFSLLSNLPTQPVELQDAGLASQFAIGTQWTLSCWAKTPTPPKAILAFADTSAGNNQGTSFSGGEVTMTAIQTKGDWVKYKATFPCDQVPSAGSKCLRVYADTKGGMVLWTGFQLEPGPVATPFEHRPIGTELALCQRYYYKFPAIYNQVFKNGYYESSALYFPVSMRTAPSMTSSDSWVLRELNGGNNIAYSGFAYHVSLEGFFLSSTTTNNLNFYTWISGKLIADAEL